jgi:hypothetical protein
MIDHTVKRKTIERKYDLALDVSGVPDLTERLGSKRTLRPQELFISYRQDGGDAPVILWHVTVRGPLRLKSGELSSKVTCDVNSYFWQLVWDEREELDDSFPLWVRELVEEYWPELI